MPHDQTLAALLAAAREAAREQDRAAARIEARQTWVRQAIEALKAANRDAAEAWRRFFDALPEDLDDEELEAMDLPDPPEQARLEAILAELEAVTERDLWPRELYWSL